MLLSMSIEYLKIEAVGNDVRVTCDRLSLHSIRGTLSKQGIEISPENEIETIIESHTTEGKELNDLVEFYARSATEADVCFGLDDLVKRQRPYPRN